MVVKKSSLNFIKSTSKRYKSRGILQKKKSLQRYYQEAVNVEAALLKIVEKPRILRDMYLALPGCSENGAASHKNRLRTIFQRQFFGVRTQLCDVIVCERHRVRTDS